MPEQQKQVRSAGNDVLEQLIPFSSEMFARTMHEPNCCDKPNKLDEILWCADKKKP